MYGPRTATEGTAGVPTTGYPHNYLGLAGRRWPSMTLGLTKAMRINGAFVPVCPKLYGLTGSSLTHGRCPAGGLSVVTGWSSVVVGRRSSVVRRLLSVVRCPSSVVRLLSVCCPWARSEPVAEGSSKSIEQCDALARALFSSRRQPETRRQSSEELIKQWPQVGVPRRTARIDYY